MAAPLTVTIYSTQNPSRRHPGAGDFRGVSKSDESTQRSGLEEALDLRDKGTPPSDPRLNNGGARNSSMYELDGTQPKPLNRQPPSKGPSTQCERFPFVTI